MVAAKHVSRAPTITIAASLGNRMNGTYEIWYTSPGTLDHLVGVEQLTRSPAEHGSDPGSHDSDDHSLPA